ncbi:uncharacterized protein FIBRA_01691 [Fibroporia radiculosa]|uniref:Protein kinase regulator n=1 Tax=Fibroporia radiculosa TaxID=599839 RepID=J4GL15_9APHY|nr:uncharacterized protein FIBRA_01691 [Fibroporia radiculosa]CCL99670.1 predicted protein [Fibroporia radiculosa]
MDASSGELRTSILEWDEGDVHAYLAKLGFPQYESQVREHRITGDVLCLLDAEGLKEMGIATIGQRLSILKGVYNIKLAQGIPIESDHYVPPSEVEERKGQLNVDRLYNLLREQSERLKSLEEDNRRLSESLDSCLDDVSSIRSSTLLRPQSETESPVRQHSFKWASFVKPVRSPTKPAPEPAESPQPSPQRLEHDINSNVGRNPSTSDRSRSHAMSSSNDPASMSRSDAGSSSSQPPKPVRHDSSDNLKSFKVSLEDPAWKVLPAALKKYKINNDDWQNYAMFICYGTSGNRIERCLSYDEKPLLLFQKLKDAKKNPVFMLKHIKDIRSPIAVAQQKQAARRASSESSTRSPPLSSAQLRSQGHSQGGKDISARPPKLQVNSQLNVASGLMTGVSSAQSGWPELMSPAVESKDRIEEVGLVENSKSHNGNGSSVTDGPDTMSAPTVLREIPPSTGVSYAVAIYPYMAEQEDEFDVVVGDTFIILSRSRGWWVVQRDPAGAGTIEPDTSKQGWVPAGCLLETKVPVASAIAEATSRGGSTSNSPPESPGKTPILPLSILSTSFPGIALMDYKKKGDEELNLAKDDFLRVFKRYNHWSYAVKEETGDRGWVPSWFIGKVPTTAGAPQTPSTSSAPNTLTASYGEGDSRYGNDSLLQQNQVSPMSSAFPPMQTRTAAVV